MPPSKPKKEPLSFTLTPKVLWIIFSSVVGLLVAVVGGIQAWNAVWDKIDSHWRLEIIQKAQDDKIKAEMKAISDKAERGRAWVFWGLSDFKAEWREQLVEDCRAKNAAQCAKLEASATRARNDEIEAKRGAMSVGKEAP